MKCNPSVINRIKRAEGQISGVLNMIEQQRDCDDLTTQLKAIENSIRKTITILTVDNLKDKVFEKHKVDLSFFEEEIDLIIKR